MTVSRKFKRPVNWLLGRQMIATLKETFLYAAYGKKMDPKDWMKADRVNLSASDPGKPFPEGEFWFDYLSDTGDGMKAVYNLAYLCMSDLYLDESSPSIEIRKAQSEQSTTLLRGAFLFIGGDTSYHVADYHTLAERFQQPFNWAFDDLGGVEQRLLFGIPGNHDYYDNLHGFNRQFRKPFDDSLQLEVCSPGSAPLQLKGFRLAQEASYVALELPFGWNLWGIDAQKGEIDFRQKEFFRSQPDKDRKKLIIVMPEPTTVFGQPSGPNSEIAETFRKLDDLPAPFLKDGELASDCCRLELAGDVHHYARYWGEGEGSNYASVVSGAGGAFLHPSHPRWGELEPNSLYPKEPDSHRVVTREVLKPWNLIWGGYVWLVGALVALTIYFGLIVVPSSREFFQHILGFSGLKLVDFAPKPPWKFIDQVAENLPLLKDTPIPWVLLLYYFAALILLVAAVWWTALTIKRAAKGVDREEIHRIHREEEDKTKVDRLALEAQVHWYSYWPVIGFLLALALITRGWWYQSATDVPVPVTYSSLLVLFCLALGAVILRLARKYGETFLSQARLRKLNLADRLPLWFMAPIGFGFIFFGLWFNGTYPAVFLVGDLLALAVLGGVLVGLPILAYSRAGRRRWFKKVGFLFLGFWHAVLQVLIPLFLSLHFCSWKPVQAILLVAVVNCLAILIFCRLLGTAKQNSAAWRKKRKHIAGWLLASWLSLGFWLLWFLWPVDSSIHPQSFLAVVLVVGGIGALSSCVWFGWYLAVSLAFNGHYNEAGGAARVEKFKQFIRFKLTEDTLTGYVIAFDEPQEKGADLKPHLVEAFQLKAAPSKQA